MVSPLYTLYGISMGPVLKAGSRLNGLLKFKRSGLFVTDSVVVFAAVELSLEVALGPDVPTADVPIAAVAQENQREWISASRLVRSRSKEVLMESFRISQVLSGLDTDF